MPWRNVYVEPELYVEHKGVRVYHTYKDDDYEQGARHYWFTLHPACSGEEGSSCGCGSETCRNVFDVRALPTWNEPTHHSIEDEAKRRAIQLALDQGILGGPRTAVE